MKRADGAGCGSALFALGLLFGGVVFWVNIFLKFVTWLFSIAF